MTASPTPEHNFDTEIVVHGQDEFWHRKYGYDEDGRVVRIAQAEDVAQTGEATDVHLPSPSYWPLVLASGLPFIGWGLIFNLWICVPGAVLLLVGIYGWVFEPADDPDAAHGHHDDDDHDDPSDGAAAELEEATNG